MTNQDRGVAMGGWAAVVTGERPWQGGGHAGPRPEELGRAWVSGPDGRPRANCTQPGRGLVFFPRGLRGRGSSLSEGGGSSRFALQSHKSSDFQTGEKKKVELI